MDALGWKWSLPKLNLVPSVLEQTMVMMTMLTMAVILMITKTLIMIRAVLTMLI